MRVSGNPSLSSSDPSLRELMDRLSLSSEDVVCSVFDGDYHLGLVSLLNSLVAFGFEGLFWIGCRDALPPWTEALQKLGSTEGVEVFAINDAVRIVFEKLDTSRHLTNIKPYFMLSLYERSIATERLFYFDPDIVNDCPWPFYRKWVNFGVTLCEEAVNGTMPSNHPLRMLWMEMAAEAGWSQPARTLNRYYNGGFVGVTRRDLAFLEVWERALLMAAEKGLDLDVFMKGGRTQPFYASDQDALNVAAMYFAGPLSTVGPEAMGFVSGGFMMHHAAGGTKPWRKKFLVLALQGIPPSMADKRFLACADGTLRGLSKSDLRWRRLQAKMATALARFYKRP